MMLNWSRERVRRFAADESGLIMTEFLILLPLLVWTFMALVVYWDTWRTINEAQKASYAVADLISRQNRVDNNFVTSMETVMRGLMGGQSPVSMRITSVQWRKPVNENGVYSVIFSRSPNNRKLPLTAAQVNNNISHLIPAMNSGDTAVILETWTDYTPGFDVGIPLSSFQNFIVTKPRFYRCVFLQGTITVCPT